MKRGRPMKCPYCRATEIIHKGYRRTVTLGDRELRQCKACGRRFTKGAKKLTTTQETVTVTRTEEEGPSITEENEPQSPETG